MPVVFAIRDADSGEFYQQKATNNGWYDDICGARFFKSYDGAQHTIDKGNHHVSYPGGRDLRIHAIKLKVIV